MRQEQMRAVYVDAPGSMAMRDVDVPVPIGEDVLVQLGACGVCGTDFHIFGGHVSNVRFPLIPGHEAVGVIAELGDAVTHLQIGQRVVVEGKAGTGFTRNGGYAEYLTVPQSQIVPLADHVDFVNAAMIDPLACAIHAVNQAQVNNGSTVVVIGQGSSGLCTLQALKALTDARVAVIDRHDDKLELSSQFGADLVLHSGRDDIPAALRAWSGSDGADYAIEVTGSASGAQLAIGSVHFAGRVVIYGVFDGPIPIDLNELRKNEIEVVGATGSPGTYPLAAELVSGGRVNLRPIVSRIIRLHDIPELFSGTEQAANTRKAVIDFTTS